MLLLIYCLYKNKNNPKYFYFALCFNINNRHYIIVNPIILFIMYTQKRVVLIGMNMLHWNLIMLYIGIVFI